MAIPLIPREDDFRNYLNEVAAYLLDVAKDVATLVNGKPAVMERFRQQIRAYDGMWRLWAEAEKADREKCWTPAIGRPVDPLDLFSPTFNNPYRPEKEAEQLPGFYSVVAFLHDRELPHLEKINNGIVTSQEMIKRTLHMPADSLEGVNVLRSDISTWADAYAIDECLNWVNLDLRDHLESSDEENKSAKAELGQRIRAMADVDLFQQLAQMLEIESLFTLLKDKTWRGFDGALAPWFGEAIQRLRNKGIEKVGVLEYEYQTLLFYVRGMQTKNVRGRTDAIFGGNALKYAGELASAFARLANERTSNESPAVSTAAVEDANNGLSGEVEGIPSSHIRKLASVLCSRDQPQAAEKLSIAELVRKTAQEIETWANSQGTPDGLTCFEYRRSIIPKTAYPIRRIADHLRNIGKDGKAQSLETQADKLYKHARLVSAAAKGDDDRLHLPDFGLQQVAAVLVEQLRSMVEDGVFHQEPQVASRAGASTEQAADRQEQPGKIAASGQISPLSLVGEKMGGPEIRLVREYADRVAELLDPMNMPSIERTWESEPPGQDYTNRVAERIMFEQAKTLHPLKVEYRKRVIALVEDGWEPIADIFEHYVPQVLGRLDGWRREILDHTDPARGQIYWLECREGKFGSDPQLKDRIKKLENKLRREAERAQTALNRVGPSLAQVEKPTEFAHGPVQPLDIPVLVERLKALRSALDGGKGIDRIRDDLMVHVGSAERLYETLKAPLRGLPQLLCVYDAQKHQVGTGLYPAIFDGLATEEVITELERWQARPSSAAEIKSEADSRPKRKSKAAKFAAIAEHLRAHPTAFSAEVSKATGIHESDVRRLWRPIKKVLKEGKADKPDGWRDATGNIEAVDESASCRFCHDPLREPFECESCREVIRGECRTCHFTQTHPDEATP